MHPHTPAGDSWQLFPSSRKTLKWDVLTIWTFVSHTQSSNDMLLNGSVTAVQVKGSTERLSHWLSVWWWWWVQDCVSQNASRWAFNEAHCKNALNRLKVQSFLVDIGNCLLFLEKANFSVSSQDVREARDGRHIWNQYPDIKRVCHFHGWGTCQRWVEKKKKIQIDAEAKTAWLFFPCICQTPKLLDPTFPLCNQRPLFVWPSLSGECPHSPCLLHSLSVQNAKT